MPGGPPVVRPLAPLVAATLAALVLAAAPAVAQRADPASYRLPFEAGKSYRCTQSNNGQTSHSGTGQYAFDFAMVVGTKIAAARSGRVIRADDQESKNGKSGRYGGAGNNIRIDHGDGTVALYFHLAHEGALVEVGDWVVQGDVIGLSGNTGNSTGPHLHFQVNRGVQSIEIRFADVETDGGIPASGKTYVSGNVPGIPVAKKDELQRLEKAARAAEAEGFLGIAFDALTKHGSIDLDVDYPPRAACEKRRAELETHCARLADELREEAATDFERAARTLVLAYPAVKGLPGQKALRDLEKELEKDPRFGPIEKERKLERKLLERYAKGLDHELLGKPPRALGHYRYVARRAEGTDLGARVRERLEALTAELEALARSKK